MPETAFAAHRAQLEDEAARILDQLRQIGRAPGTEELTFDEGFADTSQVTAERGELDALASSLLENLEEVRAALRKLDAGTYGECERCGARIGEARLEAMPSARLCITCASAAR